MVKQIEFASKYLPKNLKCQIVSFLRITWAEGFVGKNRLRNWISKESDHPYHIMLVEKDILIAHTEVVWKKLIHEKVTYKAYGLSGIFTYPNFRGEGYGVRIMKAGTEYIKKQNVDIGIFHCNPKLKDYYTKGGWIAMEHSPATLIGPKKALKKSNELMMMFLSEKGKKGRKSFEAKALYFGEDTTW